MPFEFPEDVVVLRPKRGSLRHRNASRKAAAVRSAVRAKFPDDERYFDLFKVVRRRDFVAAYEGAHVVGLMLLQRPGRDVFRVKLADFIRVYGRARGLYLFLAYRTPQRLAGRGDRYIASIWVAPAYRGSGIGGRMLALARREETARVWSVNARPGGSERFFAREGFTPRRGVGAALLRLATGCAPMGWTAPPATDEDARR